MLAFLGMMALVVVPVGPERCSSWSKRSSWLAHICSTPMCVLALAYGYKGWQPYDGLFYHLMLVTVEWQLWIVGLPKKECYLSWVEARTEVPPQHCSHLPWPPPRMTGRPGPLGQATGPTVSLIHPILLTHPTPHTHADPPLHAQLEVVQCGLNINRLGQNKFG